MRRRLISKKLYTYSVKYNYVGGKIYANDALVGTITDVNIPVVFHHKDPQVTIRAEFCPTSTSSEKVTGETTRWGNATSVTGHFQFDRQWILPTAKNILELTYRLFSHISAMEREFKTYDVVTTTTTTYSPPEEKVVEPGEYQLKYKKSVSTSNDELLKSKVTKAYDRFDCENDIADYHIIQPVIVNCSDGTSETLKFNIWGYDELVCDFSDNKEQQAGIDMYKEIVDWTWEGMDVSGNVKLFGYSVPVKL